MKRVPGMPARRARVAPPRDVGVALAEQGLRWPSEREVDRLRAAGFAPVLRWVDVANRDDKPWKAIEVLTMLDRREAKEKG